MTSITKADSRLINGLDLAMPRPRTSHSIQATIPLRAPNVRGLGVNASLESTAAKAGSTVVRLTEVPATHTMRLTDTAPTPPARPVYLWQGQGACTRVATWATTTQNTEMSRLYEEIKTHLAPGSDWFEIKIDRRIAFYRMPGSQTILKIDLAEKMETDPHAKTLLDQLITVVDQVYPSPCRLVRNFAAGKKGYENGLPALNRANSVLRALPSNFDDGAKTAFKLLQDHEASLPAGNPVMTAAEQKTALQRMKRGEVFFTQIHAFIETKRTELQTQIAAIPAGPDQTTLQAPFRAKLQEWQVIERRLQQIDHFALPTAIAFLPQLLDSRTVSERAIATGQKVHEFYRAAHEQATTGSWKSNIPDWPGIRYFREDAPQNVPYYPDYANDVSDHLFSAMDDKVEARIAATDARARNQSPIKVDHISDDFLHGVVHMENAAAQNRMIQVLTANLANEEVKDEIQAEVQSACANALNGTRSTDRLDPAVTAKANIDEMWDVYKAQATPPP